MSNPNMESKVKELMELRRMKEELEAEITAAEDEIKQVMGEEEMLFAGSYKVLWKPVTTTRFDSARFKKDHHLPPFHRQLKSPERFAERPRQAPPETAKKRGSK